MTYRALLIGNSTFEADASLNPLNAPTKDVARLHQALVDKETGLFRDENVRLVTERTSDELLDELDAFFDSADREDLLMLYYSGHGLVDQRNQLYLCGRNTRSDRLLRTAVSNVRINEFIAQSVARCTVIVLDCCASGMFKGGDIGLPLAGPGRYVVSSTRGSALANDAATPTGTSLFTEYLVAGLLGEAEDRDGDGYVDLREIYDYVRNRLTTTTKQVPHSRFDGDAEVTLARRRRPGGSPVLGKVSRSPDRAGPAFALSENVITLRDVDPDERLRDEVVEIYPLGDAEIDCAVETSGNWLMAELQGHQIVLHLRPKEGPNRSKIMVRDRRSGTVQALRVEAYVRRRSATTPPPAAEGGSKGTPAPHPDTAGTSPRVEPPAAPVVPPQATGAKYPTGRQDPWPPQRGSAKVPQPPLWTPPPHHNESEAARQSPAPNEPPGAQPTWSSPPVPLGRPFQKEPMASTSGWTRTTGSGNGSAKAAVIIAIVALLTSWLLIGGLIAVAALVCAHRAAKDKDPARRPTSPGLIYTARALAILSILISIIFLIVAAQGA